ncbi:MAG: GAF domain-containing protein, partial [Proteobacteria bacterium]|nr:GAF domain-containing protein [Pseudomonadota bacterium]
IPVFPESELSELSQDINFVAEMLESLSRDAEIQLQRHTEHIARKNKSQKTLYDVVTSINMSRNVHELLTHFLHTMKELVDARGAVVFLETKKNTYSLIAGTGIESTLKDKPPFLPESMADSNEQQTVPIRVVACPLQISRAIFDGERLSVLVIPLQYRGKVLGVYNLYIEEDKFKNDGENRELFTSMGRHLGIAVEKARLDEEAKALSIMRERTNIANELHDSLAQTLASIRYQVRVLDETIHQGDEAAAWQELERIESTIDEAHTELRALIAHFRLPIGERSLTVSVEQVIERFKQDSDDIQVYLQKEWPDTMLPPQIELQVLRVIQEALTNVRKHSEAGTVRVLMRGDGEGHYAVLVEDDGIGITDLQNQNPAGEHVGISVMQDRANRIGGTLTVDGEPGEGVQVRFEFDYLPDGAQESVQHEMV